MKLQRLFCLVALISAVSMAGAARQEKETPRQAPKENAAASSATAKVEHDGAADDNALSNCWSARQCKGKSRTNSTLEACKRGTFGKSWGPAPGPGCKSF